MRNLDDDLWIPKTAVKKEGCEYYIGLTKCWIKKTSWMIRDAMDAICGKGWVDLRFAGGVSSSIGGRGGNSKRGCVKAYDVPSWMRLCEGDPAWQVRKLKRDVLVLVVWWGACLMGVVVLTVCLSS